MKQDVRNCLICEKFGCVKFRDNPSLINRIEIIEKIWCEFCLKDFCDVVESGKDFGITTGVCDSCLRRIQTAKDDGVW